MLNQCQFIGHLGADPEFRSTQAGKKIGNLRLAVTEKWRDQQGERREKTEWVSVVIFSEGLAGVAERFLRKGSKVFVSGKMATRKWQDQSGNDRYSTEIILQGFDAKLVMLDGASGQQQDDRLTHRNQDGFGRRESPRNQSPADLDDEVPF
ncbi:single-stranded DNA-binding protein [Sphingobium sp. DC-2]|uniref:single-stranded DNA-binding protein n=1 Tax=Sphingobium sp. DC-2 TaxID=1303256 RepID=UPI0004C35DD7|nr:single-stranded DNA-binding protein [Sphingobium sp. DC-2]